MAKKETGVPYSPTLDRIGQSVKREARTVSWDAVSKELLGELVVAAVDSGGSVLFGTTRDRGAWALTFFHDQLPNKKMTVYCNSEEMLESFVSGQVEIWRDVGAELRGSKA